MEYKVGMIGKTKTGKTVIIRTVQNDQWCHGTSGQMEFLGSPIRNKIKRVEFNTVTFDRI
jgi:hypothetical protein